MARRGAREKKANRAGVHAPVPSFLKPGDTPHAPRSDYPRWAGFGLIALVVAAGLVAWGAGIEHRGYDFDEVLRAHSFWMTSQGLRPYYDFFECHPPYFALLAPLAARAEPAVLLFEMRAIAAIGNLLLIGGLMAAAVSATRAKGSHAILATSLIAFHPAVVEFLLEFRIDGWGYAIAVWEIVRLLRRPSDWRRLEFGAATAIAALLLCPKVAPILPLVVLFEQVKSWESVRSAALSLVAYATGLALGAAAFLAYLAVNGISIWRVFDILVRYNSIANAHSGFGLGLLQELLKHGAPALLAAAGIVAWGIVHIRSRSLPDPFSCAALLWLAAQAAFVSYPFKQYYAPWLLFASVFIPNLGPLIKSLPKAVGGVLISAACAYSVWMSTTAAHSWAAARETRFQEAVIRFMGRVSNPEDRVVASPPCHPIDRRDTFYTWVNSLDASGFGTEGALDQMPDFKDLVSERRYREELAAHPPVFVVLTFGQYYPPRQRSVLERFMDERGYVPVGVGGIGFAVRPDRAQGFSAAWQPP